MNYTNFLRILFGLLLHVPILYPSEMEKITQNRKNPLMNVETYLDDSRNFTLDKAEKIITKKKNIVNFQETSPKGPCYPLKWLCINGCSLEPLNEKNRLEIATLFLQKGTNDESIKEAWMFCIFSGNQYLERANSEIKKVLRPIKQERGIIIKTEEIIKAIEKEN